LIVTLAKLEGSKGRRKLVGRLVEISAKYYPRERGREIVHVHVEFIKTQVSEVWREVVNWVH
jgi:hypothetical protein